MQNTVYGEARTMPAIAAQWLTADTHQYIFKLHPELWDIPEVKSFYQGRTWTKVKFEESEVDKVPSQPGVYMFVAEPKIASLNDHSYIFYVGKASILRTRFQTYFKEMRCELENNRKHVVKFLIHLNAYLFFHFTLINVEDIEKAEALLKDNIDPPANVQTDVVGRLDV